MITKSVGYKPFLMFALAHTMQHIYTFVLPPLLPIFKMVYGLSYFQSGLLSTMLSVGLTAQLAMGVFSDRMGKRVAFVSLGLVSTAFLVGAIGLTHNYLMLAAVILLIGVAASAYHPTGTTLVTEYYSGSSRGKALGIHSIGDSLGPGISPILVGSLTAMLGWHYAVCLLAIPGVLIGFAYWRTVGEVPEKHPYGQKQQSATENIDLGLRPVMTNFAVILMAMFFTMMVSVGMMVFFTLYLVDVFQVSQPLASLLLGILFISGMPGGLIGGWASDKFGRKPVSLLSLAAGPILVICVLQVGIGIVMLILLCLTGFFGFLLPPTFDALLADITPTIHRGKIYAFYFTATGIWASVVPLISGGIADILGLQNTLNVIALVALSGIVFGLMIKEKM